MVVVRGGEGKRGGQTHFFFFFFFFWLQLFQLKGNYDEGFGREQHKTKWNGSSGFKPLSCLLQFFIL